MGLFSSIGKLAKSAVGAVSSAFKSPLGSAAGYALGSMVGYPGLGAAIGGGLSSYFGQEKANDANSAQALRAMEFTQQSADKAMAFEDAQATRAMDFSKKMSNTAWQRGVRDMRRAGINPILAYQQGGASSPQGSMAKGFTGSGFQATMQNSEAAGMDAFNSTVNSALAYKKLKPELDILNATAQRTAAEYFRTQEQGWLANQQKELTAKDAMLRGAQWEQVKAETKLKEVQAASAQQLYDIQKEYIDFHKTRGKAKDNLFYIHLGELTGAFGNLLGGAGTKMVPGLK